MKVIIVVSPDFNNKEVLENELISILDLYSYNTDYTEFEYIFAETSNTIIEEMLEELDLSYTRFKPKWDKYKNSAFNKNLAKMIEYAITEENCLIIDFQEYYSFSKYKKKIYRKYSDKINIFLITFILTNDFLECCNQALTQVELEIELAEDYDIFDFFECDICKSKFMLLKELIDGYFLNNVDVEIIQKKNYLKGEYI